MIESMNYQSDTHNAQPKRVASPCTLAGTRDSWFAVERLIGGGGQGV